MFENETIEVERVVMRRSLRTSMASTTVVLACGWRLWLWRCGGTHGVYVLASTSNSRVSKLALLAQAHRLACNVGLVPT